MQGIRHRESCNVWGRYYLQVWGQIDPCIVVSTDPISGEVHYGVMHR
jgi:hypothetical protein